VNEKSFATTLENRAHQPHNKFMPRYHPHTLAFARELRHPQTPAEQKVWQVLRNRQCAGYKFRRQHPIGPFIVDFYCAQTKLVIEIDGDTHADQIEYDLARTEYLNQQGYRVLRFTNNDVHTNIDAVYECILVACQCQTQITV